MKRHLASRAVEVCLGEVAVLLWGMATLGSLGCSEVNINVVDECDNRCVDGEEICQSGGICRPLCLADRSCRNPELVCQDGVCKTQDELLCQPGTIKCSDDAKSVMICDKETTRFVLKEKCSVGMECNSGRCMEEACVADSMRCNENNVEKCSNHSYMLYSQCSDEQRCDPETFTCKDLPKCTEGQKKCSDNDVQICLDGSWQSHRKCAVGLACDPATLDCAQAAVCVNGVKECVGDAYRECVAGQWSNKECEPGRVCRGQGVCGVSSDCENGEMRCEESGGVISIEICSNGRFIQSGVCSDGEVCQVSGKTAQCKREMCPVAFRCEGKNLQKCDSETLEFSTISTCSSEQACNSVKGQCDNLCNNGFIDPGEECDGNLFQEGATCSTLQGEGYSGVLSCDPVTCKVIKSGCSKEDCEPDTRECDGTIFRECANGAWKSYNCANDNMVCAVNRPDGCYKPSDTAGFDHVQDFENYANWKVSQTYTNKYIDNISDKPVAYEFVARTDTNESASKSCAIDGSSIIMRKSNGNYFSVSNIDKGIKKLSFQWRTWSSLSGSAELTVSIGSLSKKYTTDKPILEAQTVEISVDAANQKQTSFKIEPTGDSSARVVIDNIMWSNR